jgi:transposase
MNPYLRDERRATRKNLLASAEKKLGVIRDATLKAKNPLTGESKIAMKVGKVFAKNPLEKHFLCTIAASSFSWMLNAQAIADKERSDGIYVIRTNVPQAELTRADAVGVCKRLAKVERAFRCMKMTDLAIRPVYHFRSDRVITHVFLCMLAYYVEWHMRHALAPKLFQEHDQAGKAATWKNPVEPAQLSEVAPMTDSRSCVSGPSSNT